MATAFTFTATGQSQPAPIVPGDFNFSLWGTFVATVQIERSFDKGTTWLPVTILDQSMSFSAPLSTTFSEPAYGTYYRVNCTSYTSGTVNGLIGL